MGQDLKKAKRWDSQQIQSDMGQDLKKAKRWDSQQEISKATNYRQNRIRSPSLPNNTLYPLETPNSKMETPSSKMETPRSKTGRRTSVPAIKGQLIPITPPPINSKPAPPTPRKENHYVKYPGKKIFVGLYDYKSETDGDLNFQKDDKLDILKEEGEWFQAKHLLTGQTGYVPSNYVAALESLDIYEWYHGEITRKRATKDLLAPGNIRYTFLVRESNTDGVKAFALSVLDEDEKHEKAVKHYRIRPLSDNNGFYLVTSTRFPTLEQLVNYYKNKSEVSGESDGVILSSPCAKAIPTLWELSKDKWEISRGELEYGKLLGSGKFGEVYEGRWRNKPVAIKTLKVGSMDPEKFLEEADIMKKLRHRKLVALYAVCTAQQPFYIVTELVKNGCLLHHLRKDKGQKILLPNLIDIAGQVAEGMMFLETKGYIHRDLAARNILVADMNQVKIGDFGLAVAASDVLNIDKGEIFPVKWTAPEAMRENRFTIKSDVWSFGVLLVELLTYGQIPYPNKTNKETLQFVEQGSRHPRPSLCPEVIYDLMLGCWKRIPEQRPTFESLYGSFEDYAIGDPNGQYQ